MNSIRHRARATLSLAPVLFVTGARTSSVNEDSSEQREPPTQTVASPSTSQPNNRSSLKGPCPSREKWKYRLQWVNSIVGILTLGAVVWYASIAHKQRDVMESQWREPDRA